MQMRILVLIASVVGVIVSCSRPDSGQGSRFPQFQVMESFDELQPLWSGEGDTVWVINFWATWCKPCVEELPYFEEVYARYQGQPLQMVLVSLDFPNQLETKLKPFIQQRGLQVPVIALTDVKFNDWIDQVDSSWSGAIPATLICRGKDRVFLEQSFENAEDLDEAVRSFLN